MTVYLLWHSHDLNGEVDAKLLGVYSSEQRALEARERAKALPGLRENPSGFHIDEYEVDKDHWTEGFVTMRHEKRAASHTADPTHGAIQ
jgi:hypothetical protein